MLVSYTASLMTWCKSCSMFPLGTLELKFVPKLLLQLTIKIGDAEYYVNEFYNSALIGEIYLIICRGELFNHKIGHIYVRTYVCKEIFTERYGR